MKWLYTVEEVVLTTLHAVKPCAPAKVTRRDRQESLQSEDAVNLNHAIEPGLLLYKGGTTIG